MTEYEIALMHANRGQPREDHEPVGGALLEDLDPAAVERLLQRVRIRESSAFASIDDRTELKRLGVIIETPDGALTPTVAGLMALGAYPQEYFPQLNVTFVVIPATATDRVPADAPRFLDNRSINGPVPVMVEETVKAIIRNMSARTHISGVGRSDIFDYPVEALREAVSNALMHRDYSALSRGTQVQVEMYADRLTISNPGGLFGTVTEDDLGSEGVSSSRNSHLARLLQDVTLPQSDRVGCENRGTGIPAMIHALRAAGLTTPQFESKTSRFRITVPKHALLDAEIHAWLSPLGQDGLTDAQCMALALMRDGRAVTNKTLRQLGLDRASATTALTDLVARGLALSTQGRRYATYSLTPDPMTHPQLSFSVEEDEAEPVGPPARVRRNRLEERSSPREWCSAA